MAETKARNPNTNATEPAQSGKRKFREIVANFVVIDPNERFENNVHYRAQIEGTLVGISSQTFHPTDGREPQTVGRYKLVNDEGEIWTVLGSVALDAVMSGIVLNSYVRITFDRTVRSGNRREVKQYKVEVAE